MQSPLDLSETLTYILWDTHNVLTDMYEDKIFHFGSVNGRIHPAQMVELFYKGAETP